MTVPVKWRRGQVVVVKQGWGDAGLRMTVIGAPVFLGQWWVPVEDPDAVGEPTFYKYASLEAEKKAVQS